MNWKFPKYQVDKSIDWDEIEASYDWFRDMKGVPQDEEWHAEGDVFTHTKMVVEAFDLKFDIIVMCALPGAGKDTYIDRHLKLPILSLDDIRRENKIDPSDKKMNGQVIQLAKEKAKSYMRAKTSFVFNATNITSDMRGKWISLFTDYGARVKIVYLEVPYNVLLSQNHNREHKVPENVLSNMIGKLEIPVPKEAHEVVYEVG